MRRSRSACLLFRLSLLLVFTLMMPIGASRPLSTPIYAQSEAPNLIPDPGFETEVDPWQGCGDATQVDAQEAGITAAMVHSGSRAARIHFNNDIDQPTCGSAVVNATAQIWQGFTVPADAQDLTVSFWYSSVGETLFPLQVILGTETGDIESDVLLAYVEHDELEGWNFFRAELNLEELEAVRGKSINLFFSIFTVSSQTASKTNVAPNVNAPGSYYIDDVRVSTAIERTTASPLPADLQGDGTRPLVFLSATGVMSAPVVSRMNSDGSGVQPLYEGRASDPLNPVWSSAGDRIAVLDNSLTPEDNQDANVNPAIFTILSTINPDGSDLQEIYRTNGQPGRDATPVDPEVEALDVTINSMDWSPDDQTLALTICSQERLLNGSSSDRICWVELIDVATGDSLHKIEPAFRPDWSGDNRILFEDTDAYQARADGIWEVDMNQNPPKETLLVPGTGAQFAPSLRTENWPVWSPDHTKFATVRDVAGFHYNPDGSHVFHDAIMLFDRNSLLGESILLVDHGMEPAGLTWSPDGKYLLYSLAQSTTEVDIWWLDVATGKTGKLTNNGTSIAANWRPLCEAETCDVPAASQRLHLPLIKP